MRTTDRVYDFRLGFSALVEHEPRRGPAGALGAKILLNDNQISKNPHGVAVFWSQDSPGWLPNAAQNGSENLHFHCAFTVFRVFTMLVSFGGS